MVIVGLGNPGKEYEKTPHNVGFMCANKIAQASNMEFKLSKKHQASIAEGIINGEKTYIIKPLTYMNLSGNAVSSFVNYYNIDINDIIIIYDDMDLPLGNIRIRKTGSSGGHRGMKSIIECLKTQEIKRIRVGISHPGEKDEVIDYVLHTLTKQESSVLEKTIDKMPELIDTLTTAGFDKMMNTYNGSK